jgi:hypothetical protein
VPKSVIPPGGQDEPAGADGWMDLLRVARVEVTSEDPGQRASETLDFHAFRNSRPDSRKRIQCEKLE